MLIFVHGNGFDLDRELREEVEGKIEASFARVSHLITKIKAFLADVNGPKNGVDKSIRLLIDVEREPVIVIEEKGENWSILLDSVVDRAFQTLTRQLKRSRSRNDRTSMAGGEDALNVEVSGSVEDNWNLQSVRPERKE